MKQRGQARRTWKKLLARLDGFKAALQCQVHDRGLGFDNTNAGNKSMNSIDELRETLKTITTDVAHQR